MFLWRLCSVLLVSLMSYLHKVCISFLLTIFPELDRFDIVRNWLHVIIIRMLGILYTWLLFNLSIRSWCTYLLQRFLLRLSRFNNWGSRSCNDHIVARALNFLRWRHEILFTSTSAAIKFEWFYDFLLWLWLLECYFYYTFFGILIL